jgi:ribosomal protein S18 acetylase RimI-like enzyme
MERKSIMDVIIRQATIEDVDKVFEVEASCFPKAEAASRESLQQRISTFPESFFVAEIDGQIIGFVNGCVTNETAIYDEL